MCNLFSLSLHLQSAWSADSGMTWGFCHESTINNMKNYSLLVFILFFAATVGAKAADSLYVCRNGVYESRALAEGLEIDLHNDGDADSIVFERPAHVARVCFGEIAKSRGVRAVFVKANGEQKLATNSAMKPYAASSSSASDVMMVAVEDSVTSVSLPLSFTTNLSAGLTLTLLCGDGGYVSLTDETPIKRVQPVFVHQYAFNTDSLLSKGNWMATLPSKVKLNMISIPGSHDSATSGVSLSASKCQSLTIAEQLEAGVRAFDLRPRYTANKVEDISLDNLEIYHGVSATGVKWKDALATLVAFLEANPTEALFVNFQKESSSGADQSAEWRKSIRTSLKENEKHLLSKLTANTTLGDCRGKIVLLAHNPYGSEGVYNDIVYGALAASWGDDATFATQFNTANNAKVCDASVSDNYNATKEADKQAYVNANLEAACGDKTAKWYLTFMNVAYKLFGAVPESHAKKHNPYFAEKIAGEAYDGRLGVVFFDFCGDSSRSGDALLNALIQHNYTYLY